MAHWRPGIYAGYGSFGYEGHPRLRLRGLQSSLFGWPSTGGRLTITNPSAFELDFLHVDRFTVSEGSDDPATEDAFCLQMKRLGGTFMQASRAVFADVNLKVEEIHTILGWPESGGVWVIRKTWEALLDIDFGRVKLAKTMEERCRAIEMSGGTFFPDPRECDVTRDLVETPRTVGLALRIKDPPTVKEADA